MLYCFRLWRISVLHCVFLPASLAAGLYVLCYVFLCFFLFVFFNVVLFFCWLCAAAVSTSSGGMSSIQVTLAVRCPGPWNHN